VIHALTWNSVDTVLFGSGPYRGIRFDNPTTRAAILAQAQIHKTYTYQDLDYAFKELPRYDRLSTQAALRDQQELSKVETEINRLVNHIQQHDLQESLLDLGSQLGPNVTKAVLEDIGIIVDRIITNLSLCTYDMSIMIVKELAPHRRSGKTVNSIVESALGKARSSSRVLLREYIGSETIVSRSPRNPRVVGDQSQLYLTLLEYFTSLLGRFLVNSAEGDIWVHKCLAVLARMTAKLKLLGYDATSHAQQSISDARGIEMHLESVQEEEKLAGGKVEALNSGQGTFADLVDDITPQTVYHSEQFRIRVHLTNILNRLLDGFSQRKRVSHWNPYSLELNTIIRSATKSSEDEGKSSWLISDDRQKGTDISDQTTILRISYPGCQLLLYNLHAISQRDLGQPRPSLSTAPQEAVNSVGATIDWSFSCRTNAGSGFRDDMEDVMSSTKRPSLRRDVNSPEDYVSILAPLLLSSSPIAKETLRLITFVQSSRGTEKGIKLYDQQSFEAMFTFRCTKGQQVEDDFHQNDVIPLSSFKDIGWQSGLSDGENSGGAANEGAGPRSLHRWGLRPNSSSSDVEMGNPKSSAPPKRSLGIQEAEKLYSQYQEKMKSWKMSDKAVVVYCNRWVLSAVGIFLAVIIIGLAILFKFGKKMTGVDRSNILIFLWTVAVVGITLSKSWYTKDWSWHDFVHRQLPCKSVRELKRVTGVPEQVIMMYLLRHDHKKFYTTGEYNSLIRRTALESADGFAIDHPLNLSTLLACGFLVFMVASEDGVHLVCIGGKKRNESIHCGSRTKVLVCRAPRLAGQDNKEVELYFKEEDFSWEISYGLYTNSDILFG
jgi:hypothetical protein